MEKLIFTGDVMIGRMVNERLKEAKNPPIIWGNTIEALHSGTFTFINLECALTRNTTHGRKDTPVFFFRSEPKHVASLQAAKVDFCALANNHILDFGEAGLLETLRVLKKNNIAYAGAGRNLQEAQEPATLKAGDLTYKVFSFTDNEPGWEAKKDRAGIFYLPISVSHSKVKEFFDRVRETKKGNTFVIVSAHWGPNMVREPSSAHREFVRAIIDNGVDIFYGHSSHVFQGIEIYKKRVILYDCGEMVDDYAVDPVLRNDESFIFEVHLEGLDIREVVLHPIVINAYNTQVNLAKGKRGQEISQKMIELCRKFGTDATKDKEKLRIKV